jgi:hypothetical protein
VTIVPTFPVYNFTQLPYQGQLSALNVWLLSQPGSVISAANGGQQIVSGGKQSQVVPIAINWSYYPTGGVSINFVGGNSGQPGLLDKILMVYINNAQSSDAVTVYFPDTGMFVTADAGSVGYYPVFTNLFVASVFLGTTGSGITQVDQTQIFFCNFAVPAFATQQVNSPTLTFPFYGTLTPTATSLPFHTISGPTTTQTVDIFAAHLNIAYIVSTAAGSVLATVAIFSAYGALELLTTVCGIATVANQSIAINEEVVWTFSSPFQLLLTQGNPSIIVFLVNSINLKSVYVSGDMEVST